MASLTAGTMTPSTELPGHCIIAADGTLGGYGGPAGLRIKQWLLDLEAGKAL
jgi:hypothetical protein